MGGGAVVIKGKYSYANLHVCGGSSESPFIFAADGDSSNGLTFSGDVLFGCDGFNSGALRIDSGTYAFNRDTKVGATKGASASLVQNGGLIKHGNNYVFHIGHGEESEGSVENNGGNWSGYHLSLGMGGNSKGRFTQNGGTIEIFSGLHIGRGAQSKCAYPLGDGSTITMTIAHYNPPSGVNYDGIGVIPDVELANGEEGDAQYDRALDILLTLTK